MIEPSEQVARDNPAAAFIIHRIDVLPEALDCRAICFEERDRRRRAAQAFQAHAASAGETVVNPGVGKQGGDDVEERLLDAIGDGAGDVAFRR